MSQEAMVVTVAATAASISYTNEVGNRARRARESADTANDKAEAALDGVEKLAGSGAIVRGDDESVADFEVGLSIPQQAAGSRVGVFATTPQPLTRPIVSEDDAADVSPYPGKTSEYTRTGLLKDTQNAKGQNVLVGVALRFVELRAFLLGLLSMTSNGQNPVKEVIRQFFRFAQGLSRALAERVTVSEPDGMAQDAYTDAIRRLLSAAEGGCRKIAQLLTLSGQSIAGAAAETVVVSLTVPKNTLNKDGDRVTIDSGGIQNGQNAADTTTVAIRLGSTTGGLIASTGAVNAPAGRSHIQRAILTRVGPNQVRVSGSAAYAGGSYVPTDTLLTWDFTQDQVIVWTVLHGSASASNITLIDNAAIFAQT